MQKVSSYDFTSRINHWVIALAMIGMLGFGLYLAYAGLPRAERGDLIGMHKAIGVLVFGFGLWRVFWRILQGFPKSLSVMPAWQETASKLAHWALLAGILLMPISGIVASLFHGRAIDVFGWFTIPAQAELSWLASLGSGVHQYAGYGLIGLIALHAGAALKHHFYDADPTLQRMLRGCSEADSVGKTQQETRGAGEVKG